MRSVTQYSSSYDALGCLQKPNEVLQVDKGRQ